MRAIGVSPGVERRSEGAVGWGILVPDKKQRKARTAMGDSSPYDFAEDMGGRKESAFADAYSPPATLHTNFLEFVSVGFRERFFETAHG